MCGKWTTMTALAVGALLTGVAAAGDTKRLVDRPADKGDTRTLQLTPADREATDTEETFFGRRWGGWGGGWGRGWGRGWGWGGGWGGWGGGLGWGGLGWGGFQSFGLGYYGWPSYYSSFGGWPYSSYSLLSSAYYAPVYSYSVPAVSYYATPVYFSSPVFGADYCPPVTVIRERVEVQRPESSGTHRYDGGPAQPIPPAQVEPLPAPKEQADPKAPKLGPAPTDRPVALPAAHTKSVYPAYGEGPDAKPAKRPAKELLVSR